MNGLCKIFSAVCVLGAMLMAGGCGSYDPQNPSGTATKGPVAGATVRYKTALDATGKYLQKDGSLSPTSTSNDKTDVTDANGKYELIPGFAVETTGGSYFDLATNTVKTAPVLKAPAGAANATALTTLVANAPTPAAAQALIANIEKLGISFDAPLDTVTSANKAAIALNEAIGALIATNPSAAALQTLATQLTTQLTTATTSTSTTQIATIVTSAATGTSINTASVSTITTAVTNLSTGPLPTPTTGTGSTGSTGNTVK